MEESQNLTVAQAVAAPGGGNGEENGVWGMPTYKENEHSNLTDEEYLAVVS